jgi:hypothetical protein
MGGRVYDPLAARFTTADPILQAPFFSQGQNRYAYVLNDPINLTDPSGFAFDTSGDVFAQGHIVGDSMSLGFGAAVGGGLAYGIASAFGGAAAATASSMPVNLAGAVPDFLAPKSIGPAMNTVQLALDVADVISPDAPAGARSQTVPTPRQATRTRSSAQRASKANKGQAPIPRPAPAPTAQPIDAMQPWQLGHLPRSGNQRLNDVANNFVDTSSTYEKIGKAITTGLYTVVLPQIALEAAGGAIIGIGRGAAVLGRGSTASLARGTTLARNLRESLAVEQAMANPTAGRELALKMTDPRWPASEGWVKMQQVIQSGGREGATNVHYLLNKVTGAIDDFKIVLQGAR